MDQSRISTIRIIQFAHIYAQIDEMYGHTITNPTFYSFLFHYQKWSVCGRTLFFPISVFVAFLFLLKVKTNNDIIALSGTYSIYSWTGWNKIEELFKIRFRENFILSTILASFWFEFLRSVGHLDEMAIEFVPSFPLVFYSLALL